LSPAQTYGGDNVPRITHTLEGICYLGDGTTVISDLNVTVTNVTRSESLDGSNISSLTTNAQGEWSVNMADAKWINDYGNGDSLKIEVSGSTGKDTETVTVDTSAEIQTGIDLWLVSKAVFGFWYVINTIGMSVTLRRQTRTYETDYYSVESETNPATDDTITMSFQIINDEERLFEWGVVNSGEALGLFKSKDVVQKNDLIQINSQWWKIADKPRLYYYGTDKTHYEARLVRVNG